MVLWLPNNLCAKPKQPVRAGVPRRRHLLIKLAGALHCAAMVLRAWMSADRCRPTRLRVLIVLTALVLGAVVGGGFAPAGVAAPAKRKLRQPQTTPVPQGFVGVDTDGPLLTPGTPIDFGRQTATMVASGVQSIRVAFSWAAAQPYASMADVPADQRSQFSEVGGRPTDFATIDMIVGDAAKARLSVLPTVLYAPSWDALANNNGTATPRRTAPYAAFLTALIGRYGPHGSFWREHSGVPKRPIRMWQIWNEPNIKYYWRQPFARSYVALLGAAHAAVKRADPGAKVVLGALTNLAWRSLGQIYRIHGARGLFDFAAVNGFTKTPAHVMRYLHFVRDAMNRFGDRAKPMLATEVSWPSASGQTSSRYDFDTTEAGQARDITTLLPLLGRQRAALRLAGFYYYTWIGDEQRGTQAFNFAGLLRLNAGRITVKPALGAFRRGALALEGCRRKGRVATSCVR